MSRLTWEPWSASSVVIHVAAFIVIPSLEMTGLLESHAELPMIWKLASAGGQERARSEGEDQKIRRRWKLASAGSQEGQDQRAAQTAQSNRAYTTHKSTKRSQPHTHTRIAAGTENRAYITQKSTA